VLSRTGCIAVIVPLVAVAGLAAASPRSDHRSAPVPTALRSSSASVKLVAAPARLGEDCVAAANRLRFAVPCPTKVPTKHGVGTSCPNPYADMPLPCVGAEGLPPYPIFALELSGFDVPSDYVGVDGKPSGHLVVEAARNATAPRTRASAPSASGESPSDRGGPLSTPARTTA